MPDRVISEVPWEYVLFEKSEKWILTFMVGGVVEVDVSVEMSSSEIENLKSNSGYAKDLIGELKSDPQLREARALSSPVWPNREAS